jgi:hypothetical protein
MACPRCGCHLRSRSQLRKDGLICTDCGFPLDGGAQILRSSPHGREALMVLAGLLMVLGLIWVPDLMESGQEGEPPPPSLHHRLRGQHGAERPADPP